MPSKSISRPSTSMLAGKVGSGKGTNSQNRRYNYRSVAHPTKHRHLHRISLTNSHPRCAARFVVLMDMTALWNPEMIQRGFGHCRPGPKRLINHWNFHLAELSEVICKFSPSWWSSVRCSISRPKRDKLSNANVLRAGLRHLRIWNPMASGLWQPDRRSTIW